MFNVPRRYVPSFLTKKDKKKQSKALRRSRRAYKKGKYYTRKKVKSFKSKVSPHVVKAKKMYKIKFTMFFYVLLSFSFIVKSTYAANDSVNSLANSYANLVSHYYNEVSSSTQEMHNAIIKFVQAPDNNSLANAKNKWIAARSIYGITEAFRFYGGPIDGVNKYGEEGPEGLINAWPLNEAYIDYVKGSPNAGIINNLTLEINNSTIIAANMSEDDADVSSGWHAIEFLLWGQDFSLETAGMREASDYLPTNEINIRRRAYLVAASTLLLEHINWLSQEWLENGEGRKAFLNRFSGKLITRASWITNEDNEFNHTITEICSVKKKMF